MKNLLKRTSVNLFDDYHWTIIPCVKFGFECAGFGYPSAKWICFSWIRWTFQVSLHGHPRDGCFFWKA